MVSDVDRQCADKLVLTTGSTVGRGLKYVSSHREERIKLIAHHLNQSDYDVVFLQEVQLITNGSYICLLIIIQELAS